MATTVLKEPQPTDAEKFLALLDTVAAKAYMIQATPGSQAEFPEFVELRKYAEKMA
jgi:formylglycine-generating enzyme required for sulfatase activity